MSQVKNLRAMFEHKGPPSPERGREGAPGPTDSPRPLSRVRTSFVTVEKDGRIGLQRDPSVDSINTISRTTGAGTESALTTPTTTHAGFFDNIISPEARPNLLAQTPRRKPSVVPEEPLIVEPVKLATPLVAVSKSALGAATSKVSVPGIFAAAPATTDKVEESKVDKENKPSDSAAAPAEKSPVRKLFGKPLSKPIDSGKTTSEAPKKSPDALAGGATRLRTAAHTGGTRGASKTRSDAPKAAAAPAAASSSLPTRSKIPSTASAPKATKSVPKAISTAKTTTTKSAPKSASLKAKTPTSPSKPQTPRLPASKPAADKKTTTAAVAEKKSTPAAAAPKGTAGKKPSGIQTFPPNGAAFVKPKTKSPTRPVSLPPSLTTHTAASSTKTRQNLSRQSGNYLATHGASHATATRPLSRASGEAAHGAASSDTNPKVKTLRRQKSTIGPQRPSIGPPPKQAARDHPVTKKEKAVDEDFLERLMRPTQSFACKTADKVHQSPPRSNRSRSSFGSSRSTRSARSTASSTRALKEKTTAVSKSAPADETEALAASPVIVVASSSQEEHETIEFANASFTESAVESDVGVESELEPEAVQEPEVEEPKAVQQPEVEEPKVEEPKTVQAEVEEPKFEAPKIEEPKFEAPKIEEPKAVQAEVEEPKTVQVEVEEHKVEEVEIAKETASEAPVTEAVESIATPEEIPETVNVPAVEAKQVPVVAARQVPADEAAALAEIALLNAAIMASMAAEGNNEL